MDNGTGSYRRFLAGDDNGFVELVRDYKDGLILYLNSFTNDIHTAEILAEDTFVKLGIKKPKDTKKASFKTWLYTIGRNLAIDYLRKHYQFREVALEECSEQTAEEDSLEKAYIRQEQKILLHRAMRRLKPIYRQVLWLIYFDGFSNKEAAKIMKKSVHATETLVYRARLSLKSELKKENFDDENL